MGMDQVTGLFERMKNYSGQLTKPDHPLTEGLPEAHGLQELIARCLDFYETDTESRHTGIKEIMCEEFIPYLCDNGFKCILIVRDPRDVLASANYPRGEKYLGGKKPTLFVLRNWRKSVEFAYLLRNQDNFHLLRYEDLVENPYSELRRITDFLELPAYKDNHFEKGILDRHGNTWQANSSFGIEGSFIAKRPKDMFRNSLNSAEIQYTEAICRHELNWLGYRTQEPYETGAIVSGFKDYGVEDSHSLSADFSSNADNVKIELNRLKEFADFYRNG